jgi:hypothetical protein
MGYPLIDVVERWIPGANIRKDLFGFIDILAVGIGGDVLAVQATSRSNVSSRIKKIADHPGINYVRRAGWTIEVWGWYKRDGRWIADIKDVS